MTVGMMDGPGNSKSIKQMKLVCLVLL